jgi:hypothetical protein
MGIMGSFLVSNFSLLAVVKENSKTSYQLSAITFQLNPPELKADS